MIHTRTSGQIAVVEIDRQEQRNALDIEHCDRLRGALDDVVADGTRCVVLTGAGTAFCAGADLNQVYSDGFRTALYQMLRRVTEVPVPVIAAVNGPAIGAGTQLAIASDLRVAVPSASFGIPAAKLGLAVDPWTIRRLALHVGSGPARRMLFTGEPLDATDAHRYGLVDRLSDAEAALEWATEVAALAPLSNAYHKLAANTLLEPELDPATERGLNAAFEACWNSADFAEARQARQDKRPPRFQGR